MAFPTQMNPMLLAALMQQGQNGQGQGLSPQMPGPGAPGAGAGPQIPQMQPQGMGGAGGMMMRPPMGAVGAGASPQAGAPGGMNAAQLMSLMQMMKGPGQTPPGSAPNVAGVMPSQINPSIPQAGGPSEYSSPIGPQQPSGLMAWLQQMFQGAGGGGS